MKNHKTFNPSLWQIDHSSTLDRINTALGFLADDNEHTIHDKVAGDFDYEELISALLHAKSYIEAAESSEEDFED
jgi:hypothetical protein